MLSAGISHAQMRMLPRAKVDSIMQAQESRMWCAPFLSFDSLKVDAGIVQECAEPIEALYRFKNCGTESLSFGRIESSCSCVTASLEPAFVRPDSIATVRVVYNQKNHPGRHPRYIALYLKEPVDTCIARLVLESIVE